MDKKYNIEYLNKTRKAIYLEVEVSVAEDIDCAFQWAIARIKQLEKANMKALDFMLMARKLQYDRQDLTETYIRESIKTLEGKDE